MILIIPLTILSISFVTLSLYTFFTIKYRNGGRPNQEEHPGKPFPKVSILKPMRKIDDEIEKNIESYFLLDYPRYEILFGVDSMKDPIVEIISKIQSKFPRVSTKVIETGHANNGNPKIHKLALLAEEAVGTLYWVSDSNIRVEKDTLEKLVNEYLQKDAKIIFSPIRTAGSWTIGSIIENAYITHFVSGNVISAWKLFKQQIVIGKSILVERDTLNYFGGFSYFRDYLAEDYIMGEAYTNSKIPISINFTWVTNVNRTTTIKESFLRMERWAKLRFNLKTPLYIMEIFLNPIMLALIFSLFLGKKLGLMVFSGTLLLKILLEIISFLVLNKEDRRKFRVIAMLPFCILLKDILLFIIYFIPFFSRTVDWRGGKIKIGRHTLIHPHPEKTLI
ncbi:MAG: glycosyltransferase [Candidatus Aminicenantes bacterium]|nr:MAG: glycosyltransferase [Candidatus Aminicenantes bacterium]